MGFPTFGLLQYTLKKQRGLFSNQRAPIQWAPVKSLEGPLFKGALTHRRSLMRFLEVLGFGLLGFMQDRTGAMSRASNTDSTHKT